jgi:hypothetical protein
MSRRLTTANEQVTDRANEQDNEYVKTRRLTNANEQETDLRNDQDTDLHE